MVNLNSNLGAATNAFILKQLFVTSFSLNLIVKKCTDGSPFLFPILSFEQSLQPVTAQTAERGSYELSFQEGDVNSPNYPSNNPCYFGSENLVLNQTISLNWYWLYLFRQSLWKCFDIFYCTKKLLFGY